MIQISPRTGSKELKPLFNHFDVPIDDSVDIAFSDFCFIGNGPDGLCRVGFERKRLGDFVGSIRTGRLSGHQLTGLLSEFDYVVVIVEGEYKCGNDGELVELWHGRYRTVSDGNRSVMYRAIVNYRVTAMLKALSHAGNPVIYERTVNPYETVALIVSYFHWFNDKQWDQHRSHEAPHIKSASQQPSGNGHRPRSFIRRPVSPLETFLVAAGTGVDQAAKFVAQKFETIEQLCAASPDEIGAVQVEQFMKVGGTRMVNLGSKKGLKIWQALRTK